MKNKENQIKPVKKSSLIIAWILLIILITLALGLTYIKFFGPNQNIEEHPVNENENNNNKIITETLQKIVDNFNNSKLLESYSQNNITIIATLEENAIVIKYIEPTITNIYKFTFNIPKLTISIENVGTTKFLNVYKILIYANQERIGNTNNIDQYIDGFINNTLEVEGLEKITEEISTTYSIDISKVIGQQPEENLNNSNTTTSVGSQTNITNNNETVTENNEVNTNNIEGDE